LQTYLIFHVSLLCPHQCSAADVPRVMLGVPRKNFIRKYEDYSSLTRSLAGWTSAMHLCCFYDIRIKVFTTTRTW